MIDARMWYEDAKDMAADRGVPLVGLLGRVIAGLTEEERDALIRHPDPTFKGISWTGPNDCGCFMGCVLMERGNPYWRSLVPSRPLQLMSVEEHTAAFLFPALTLRFGPERIWRAVKLRCAKLNGIPVDWMTDREVQASAEVPA